MGTLPTSKRKSALGGKSTFRSLLRDLDSVLLKYHSELAAAGIHNEEKLRILSGFPRHEKELFIRDHCRVTSPIDVCNFRIALENAGARLANS